MSNLSDQQQLAAFAGWISAHTGESVTADNLCFAVEHTALLVELCEHLERKPFTSMMC
jgi:hypothetical protein